MPSISELYDTFSANLGLYREEYSGYFMCPLCLVTFSRDQIHTYLSKAHIIPKFLGGRDWTLTCRACNNKVGTEIESCEKERANFNWALSGDGNETTRTQTIVHDEQGNILGAVHADMRGVGSGADRRLRMDLRPKASSPEALKLLNDHLSAGQGPIRFHFRETRSSKRANLTYVHAAYLHMFNQFGYEWALSPGAHHVRRQIMSPDEPIFFPLSPALDGLSIPEDKSALFLVAESADWQSFLVVLPLFRGRSRRFGVWMPLFGRLYTQPPQQSGVKITAIPVPSSHRYLHELGSRMQGSRFVQDHLTFPRLRCDWKG